MYREEKHHLHEKHYIRLKNNTSVGNTWRMLKAAAFRPPSATLDPGVSAISQSRARRPASNQPTAGSQQPAASSQQPAASSQWPATSNQQPPANTAQQTPNFERRACKVKPQAGVSASAASKQQPALKDATANQWPTNDNNHLGWWPN